MSVVQHGDGCTSAHTNMRPGHPLSCLYLMRPWCCSRFVSPPTLAAERHTPVCVSALSNRAFDLHGPGWASKGCSACIGSHMDDKRLKHLDSPPQNRAFRMALPALFCWVDPIVFDGNLIVQRLSLCVCQPQLANQIVCFSCRLVPEAVDSLLTVHEGFFLRLREV